VSLALRVAGTDAGAASGALLQLGQALGSGTVHAEEFNSILEGVPTIAQAAAAGIKEANGSVAALKQLVVSGKLSSRAFFDGFAAGADTLADRAAGAETTISGRFIRLQNILIDTAGKFDENSGAAEMFGHFLDDLGAAIIKFSTDMSNAAPAIGEVERFLNAVNAAAEHLGKSLGEITGLDQVAPAINNALNGVDVDPVQKKLGELQKTVEALQQQIEFNTQMGIDTSVVQGQLDQVLAKIAAIRSGAQAVTAPLKDQTESGVASAINGMVPFNPLEPVSTASKPKQITLADYPVLGGSGKGSGGRGGGRNRRTADDRFQSDIQAIRDRTEAMRMEMETMGLSYREQEKRKVQFDLEKQALHDVQEAARQKGDADWRNVQLSKDQKTAIDQVSEAYAAQADALRQAQEEQDLNADTLRTAFDGIRGALEDGKITMQEWGNIGLSVLNKLIDKLENDFVDALSKTGTGGGGFFGWISSLFGGGFGTAGGFAAMLGLADGGHVSGPGTSTSDSIPAWLSDGEYVVNAKATRKHRALLEALNSGHTPHFAAGGAVGGSNVSRLTTAANFNGSPVTIAPTINMNATGGTPDQNADLAKQTAKAVEGSIRGLVADEMRRQLRPGGMMNNSAI
jgi:tape measure domain-containing protein